jgi:hypothetical protein
MKETRPMNARPEGFYWLRDKLRPTRHPNPTCAYWNGHDWEFVGTDMTWAEDEEDLDGRFFHERFAVLDEAKPAL